MARGHTIKKESASKRLRNALYNWYMIDNKDEAGFEQFYLAKMEEIINHFICKVKK